jgi:glyoxylase-like metal-dependent hydrolase (beta-lactamase superfamily II)
MNRRLLLVRIAGTCFLGVCAWTTWTQTPAPQPLSCKQIKDDLWVIEGTSNGASDAGNIAVLVTSEGIVLVDDRFEQDYREVTAAVKKISPLPIKYVMNTHHHGDHTGGNAKMLASNIEIVIQKNARGHMVDTKMPGLPRITFTEQASVFLGGKEVRSIYFGRGHTDGDVAVYIPHDRTVHLGDLMAGTRGVTNPVMDYSSGGSLKAWPATLDGALALDIDTVIPGHGSVTDKAGLVAHRKKIGAILAKATSLVRENQTSDEIGKAMVAEFDFKPINLRPLDTMIAELKQ